MTIDAPAVERLCERHGIRRLRVFGSAARGEATPSSDIDLLVDFTQPKSLFDLVEIQDAFEDALGVPVDLVTEASLSPYIRPTVLSQARVIYERAA